MTVVDAYHLPKNLALGGHWPGFSGAATAQPGYHGEEAPEGSSSDATCAAQVAYADRIVLNKVDLVAGTGGAAGGDGGRDDDETLAGLLATIEGLNPLAEVLPAERADVPVDWVLDIGAYAQEGAPLKPWQRGQLQDAKDAALAASTAVAAAPSTTATVATAATLPRAAARCAASRAHKHPLGVGSLSLVLEGCEVPSVAALEAWLAPLVWGADYATPAASPAAGLAAGLAAAPLGSTEGAGGEAATATTAAAAAAAPPAAPPAAPQPFGFLAPEVFRLKGVVAVRGSPLKHVAQAVHGLFEVNASSEAWNQVVDDGEQGGGAGGDASPAPRSVKIVVIGKHLDRRRLELSLKAIAVPCAAPEAGTSTC